MSAVNEDEGPGVGKIQYNEETWRVTGAWDTAYCAREPLSCAATG